MTFGTDDRAYTLGYRNFVPAIDRSSGHINRHLLVKRTSNIEMFDVQIVFVQNVIRTQCDRLPLPERQTSEQLEFCSFGRVLFITESISRTGQVLSTVLLPHLDNSCRDLSLFHSWLYGSCEKCVQGVSCKWLNRYNDLVL